MPATRRARHLAAGDEHFLLVTDAGEAFRGEFRSEFRAGARVAALVFDAGAPGSDGTIPRDVKITHVAAGSRHSALVDADGRVWTFGWGLYGQLGHETCEDASDPKPVAALGACFARAVAAGAAHTSVLVSTGGVYAFGSNRDGQLGVPSSACALGAATATPELVEFPWDDERRVERRAQSVAPRASSVSAVSCGARHTACVTSRGELVVWGWNAYGQLGVGDRETREAPTRVAAPARAEKKKARAVACGRWHTVVSYGDDGKPPYC
jgi:alpha-tubulin suppressor-like RCC1 family protein